MSAVWTSNYTGLSNRSGQFRVHRTRVAESKLRRRATPIEHCMKHEPNTYIAMFARRRNTQMKQKEDDRQTPVGGRAFANNEKIAASLNEPGTIASRTLVGASIQRLPDKRKKTKYIAAIPNQMQRPNSPPTISCEIVWVLVGHKLAICLVHP